MFFFYRIVFTFHDDNNKNSKMICFGKWKCLKSINMSIILYKYLFFVCVSKRMFMLQEHYANWIFRLWKYGNAQHFRKIPLTRSTFTMDVTWTDIVQLLFIIPFGRRASENFPSKSFFVCLSKLSIRPKNFPCWKKRGLYLNFVEKRGKFQIFLFRLNAE